MQSPVLALQIARPAKMCERPQLCIGTEQILAPARASCHLLTSVTRITITERKHLVALEDLVGGLADAKGKAFTTDKHTVSAHCERTVSFSIPFLRFTTYVVLLHTFFNSL